MSNNIDLSRNSILIRSKINYARRYDLEDPKTCNIWLEIKMGKEKNILLMGGYRTWSSLKSQNIHNSRSNKAQVDRFKITLENWSKAMKEGKDVLVCMDDNIDSSINNKHNKLGARTLGARSRGSKNVTYRQQTTDKKVNTEPL